MEHKISDQEIKKTIRKCKIILEQSDAWDPDQDKLVECVNKLRSLYRRAPGSWKFDKGPGDGFLLQAEGQELIRELEDSEKNEKAD